jgi:predicted HAD superfamily Cof-like phosphohydrolase
MKEELEKVKQFQILTGQQRFSLTSEPSADTLKLRLELIAEELFELAEALTTKKFDGVDCIKNIIGDKAYLKSKKQPQISDTVFNTKIDKVATLDALADLKYVLDGTVTALGMEEIFPVVFEEVDRSNTTKFCTSREAAETEQKTQQLHGVDVFIEEPIPNIYVLKRVENTKVIKPSTYSPADIRGILERFLRKQAEPKLDL